MKKILIISGDPNSVNSEIIYKSWSKISRSLRKKIYLISNYQLIKQQFKRLGYRTRLHQVKDIYDKINCCDLKIIDINLNFNDPFNVSHKSSSKFILRSLNLAHEIALKVDISGIINCSIDKKLLSKNKTGVTEFFATKCQVKKNSEAMLIWNKSNSVSPITTHLDIKDVSKVLNKKIIINKVKTINIQYKKLFKKKPKIAVLGMNPHNAEFRKNSEEKKIIIPAIKKLKKLKFNLDGPLVADTIFIKDYKKYNVIVGMYHDQVLAPFKSIFKFNAINITLGLKYLRVSPDHGTATNIIGKNKANITSFLECIKFVEKFSK